MPQLVNAAGFTRMLDSEPVANEARAVQPNEHADHAPGHSPDRDHDSYDNDWWNGRWQIEREKPHDEQRTAADGTDRSTSAHPITSLPGRLSPSTYARHLPRTERPRENRRTGGHGRDECRAPDVGAGNHEPHHPEKKAATSRCRKDS